MKQSVGRGLMFVALALPLDQSANWEQAVYSKIPKNEISYGKEGLAIKVNSSASPLIYPFAQVKRVQSFKVRGEFKGLPKMSDPSKQGSDGFDDFPLRVGFIVPGKKTLNAVQRAFAPAWVKNLYAKAPKGSGIDRIQFYSLTQNPSQKGQSREHPRSDLIREDFFEVVSSPGKFEYEFKLKEPIMASGLWISTDGDDTKSAFEVLISNLEIGIEE